MPTGDTGMTAVNSKQTRHIKQKPAKSTPTRHIKQKPAKSAKGCRQMLLLNTSSEFSSFC